MWSGEQFDTRMEGKKWGTFLAMLQAVDGRHLKPGPILEIKNGAFTGLILG